GTTTRPRASRMSLVTFARITSPTLFRRELIESVRRARIVVPASRLAPAGASTARAGAGRARAPDGVEREGLAVSAGRSPSARPLSTGAGWRSRLRLSAATVSRRSPLPQATASASARTAIVVLDIATLLREAIVVERRPLSARRTPPGAGG